MARKRSLKDAAVEQLVEKDTFVAEEATPVVEKIKTPKPGRKKKAATRKRSLKDAAADKLVEKTKVVPEDSAKAIETPPAGPVAEAEPNMVETTPAKPANESSEKPLFNEPSAAIERPVKGHPSLKWVAILLLVGFAAGLLFDVGRALGPTNAAFILFGFAGGYLFGQFYKIL
jgi:hypothetical protein